MTKRINVLVASILLLLCSCTKEITIKEEYQPPQPSIYGTWKLISLNYSDTVYYVFTNDGSNLLHMLTIDTVGFKTMKGMPYLANQNQVFYSSTLFNYSIKSDTLNLDQLTTISYKLVRVQNPTFTPDNWQSEISIISKFDLPRNISNPPSFGIDGNILYLSGYNGSKYYVYKYNTDIKQYEDSTAVMNLASTYYLAPSIYYAYGELNYYMQKSIGLHSAPSAISSRVINFAETISVNKSNSDIYAYTYSNEMLKGKEGDYFNTIYNFSGKGYAKVSYYKDNEFLGLNGNNIVRMKINGNLKVETTYKFLAKYSFYGLSTNGVDTYVFAFNYAENKYEILKIKLN